MPSHRYPAREPKHARATWPIALPLLSNIVAGLGKSIHGVIVFVGRSIQEMGSNVVIGRSIYGVIVINGLFYSK